MAMAMVGNNVGSKPLKAALTANRPAKEGYGICLELSSASSVWKRSTNKPVALMHSRQPPVW